MEGGYDDDTAGRRTYSTTKPIEHNLKSSDNNTNQNSAESDRKLSQGSNTDARTNRQPEIQTERRTSIGDKIKNVTYPILGISKKNSRDDDEKLRDVPAFSSTTTTTTTTTSPPTTPTAKTTTSKNQGTYTTPTSTTESKPPKWKEPFSSDRNTDRNVPKNINKNIGIPGCGMADKPTTTSKSNPAQITKKDLASNAAQTRRKLSHSEMYSTQIPAGCENTGVPGFEDSERTHIPGTLRGKDQETHQHHHHHHNQNKGQKQEEYTGTGMARYPSAPSKTQNQYKLEQQQKDVKKNQGIIKTPGSTAVGGGTTPRTKKQPSSATSKIAPGFTTPDDTNVTVKKTVKQEKTSVQKNPIPKAGIVGSKKGATIAATTGATKPSSIPKQVPKSKDLTGFATSDDMNIQSMKPKERMKTMQKETNPNILSGFDTKPETDMSQWSNTKQQATTGAAGRVGATDSSSTTKRDTTYESTKPITTDVFKEAPIGREQLKERKAHVGVAGKGRNIGTTAVEEIPFVPVDQMQEDLHQGAQGVDMNKNYHTGSRTNKDLGTIKREIDASERETKPVKAHAVGETPFVVTEPMQEDLYQGAKDVNMNKNYHTGARTDKDLGTIKREIDVSERESKSMDTNAIGETPFVPADPMQEDLYQGAKGVDMNKNYHTDARTDKDLDTIKREIAIAESRGTEAGPGAGAGAGAVAIGEIPFVPSEPMQEDLYQGTEGVDMNKDYHTDARTDQDLDSIKRDIEAIEKQRTKTVESTFSTSGQNKELPGFSTADDMNVSAKKKEYPTLAPERNPNILSGFDTKPDTNLSNWSKKKDKPKELSGFLTANDMNVSAKKKEYTTTEPEKNPNILSGFDTKPDTNLSNWSKNKQDKPKETSNRSKNEEKPRQLPGFSTADDMNVSATKKEEHAIEGQNKKPEIHGAFDSLPDTNLSEWSQTKSANAPTHAKPPTMAYDWLTLTSTQPAAGVTSAGTPAPTTASSTSPAAVVGAWPQTDGTFDDVAVKSGQYGLDSALNNGKKEKQFDYHIKKNISTDVNKGAVPASQTHQDKMMNIGGASNVDTTYNVDKSIRTDIFKDTPKEKYRSGVGKDLGVQRQGTRSGAGAGVGIVALGEVPFTATEQMQEDLHQGAEGIDMHKDYHTGAKIDVNRAADFGYEPINTGKDLNRDTGYNITKPIETDIRPNTDMKDNKDTGTESFKPNFMKLARTDESFGKSATINRDNNITAGGNIPSGIGKAPLDTEKPKESNVSKGFYSGDKLSSMRDNAMDKHNNGINDNGTDSIADTTRTIYSGHSANDYEVKKNINSENFDESIEPLLGISKNNDLPVKENPESEFKYSKGNYDETMMDTTEPKKQTDDDDLTKKNLLEEREQFMKTHHGGQSLGGQRIGSIGSYGETVGNYPSLIDPDVPTYGFTEETEHVSSYVANRTEPRRKASYGSTGSAGSTGKSLSPGEHVDYYKVSKAEHKVPRSQARGNEYLTEEEQQEGEMRTSSKDDNKGGFFRRVSISIMNQLPKPKM
ncbi:Hbt1p NDAI_0H03840 [Naumovozyma dairenensis CBS 421]|uniref:Uncharacterized protein n=1 Tax=Naumovozyma dairenensis (strain ATCC 10597 / BCRC 20456 / CBS 421 / NBRC 0211 / NRRL Y-12639) TaxID=1071378 RepID=G0WFJ6_NAUDC|nr:hypothetical protein NDAI_0H03840 [Naumovozyma dairenensis CBS 421]CCD26557.1 hypothetical protein NDAI_0H03840 [Naumovozyma dairenensis CBS 421]